MIHVRDLRVDYLLKFRKQGNNYFALTLFMVWLLPVIFGLLIAALGGEDVIWQGIMCLSPLAGLGLSFDTTNGVLYYSVTLVVTTLWTAIALWLMWPTVAGMTRGLWIASRPNPTPAPVE